jgi:hypothetical protein
VFGDDESALAGLAFILATRANPRFAWINCAGTTKGLVRAARELLEHHAATMRSDCSEIAIESPVRDPGRTLATFVDPASMSVEESIRLENFLRLPPVIQRTIGEVSTEGGAISVVLTGGENPPPHSPVNWFAHSEFHRTLRHECVTLTATYHGEPSSALFRSFDCVYRIASRPGQNWIDAKISLERGEPRFAWPLPVSLRGLWSFEQLPFRLLGGPAAD